MTMPNTSAIEDLSMCQLSSDYHNIVKRLMDELPSETQFTIGQILIKSSGEKKAEFSLPKSTASTSNSNRPASGMRQSGTRPAATPKATTISAKGKSIEKSPVAATGFQQSAKVKLELSVPVSPSARQLNSKKGLESTYLPLTKSYVSGTSDPRNILFPVIPLTVLDIHTNAPNGITAADIKQLYFDRGDHPLDKIIKMIDFYIDKDAVEKYYIGVTQLVINKKKRKKNSAETFVHLHGGMNNRYTTSYVKYKFNTMICVHIVGPQPANATQTARKMVEELEKSLFEYYKMDVKFRLEKEPDFNKTCPSGGTNEKTILLYIVLKWNPETPVIV